MRKLLPFILFVSLSPLFSKAQYQQWQWAKSFGGTATDSSVDMKIKNGYLYVTGNFTSSEINWDNTILNNNGGKDIFVAKLDTNGNTIWVKNFGGTGDDNVLQLEVNNSGTVAIWCVSSSSSIALGSNTLANPKNFYIEIDAGGSILNTNVLPDISNYSDIEVSTDGSVYISGYYVSPFSFAGGMIDTSFSISGGIILKYSPGGIPQWGKNIEVRSNDIFSEHILQGDAHMKIEYNSFDNSISFLCQYSKYASLAGIGSNQSITGVFTDYSMYHVYAKLNASNGAIFYLPAIQPYIGGTLGFNINDFETGNSGLDYTNYDGGLNRYCQLQKDYNGDRTIYRRWESMNFQEYPFRRGTLKPSETGEYFMVNGGDSVVGGMWKYDLNKTEILDSSLNRKIKIVIPEQESLNWNVKCMANTNAIYFTNTIKQGSLLPNAGIPSATEITLSNNGGHDIFIGKYSANGAMPLSLIASSDRYKICSDTLSMNLLVNSEGTGQLTYHWQPATGISDTAILNPKIFITADSIMSTLTVTSASGQRFSKQFVFFKGILSDVRLIVDTTACMNDTIVLRLQASTFTSCVYGTNPYQPFLYQSSISPYGGVFNSVNDICKYTLRGSHSVKLYPFDNPSLPASPYCVVSEPINITVRDFFREIKADTICQGSSFTFPDGTVQQHVRYPMSHISYLNSINGCDSIIYNDLYIRSIPFTNQSRLVCQGGSFTFPDGTVQRHIQEPISHTSYLSSVNGCDSIAFDTWVGVLPATQVNEIIPICHGGNYTFPDGTTVQNITTQSQTYHTSFLYGYTGDCDSLIVNTYFEIVTPPLPQTESATICSGSSYTFPDNSTINNITVATTHVSHLQTINGCDSTITTNISINPTYNTSESHAVCAGSSYTFPDNNTINNITNDIAYTSHLTSINGCDSSIVTSLSVIQTDTSVTKNSHVLTANASNAGYQWLDCNNAMVAISDSVNSSFIASAIGSYAVEITSQGCKDTSSCYIISSDNFRVGNRPMVNVYPVPVRNTLNIAVQSATPATVQISIIDFYGRSVRLVTANLLAGQNVISQNVSNLASGSYTVQLINSVTGERTVKSFVKN
jgi:hypothetical protein